ncbi:MAG: hypothetical protein CVT49_14085 [candidate division Zixibacteria bacterium HGW-Zixibacteria-1]|nr:MAG: hypothetical protein CVT49_14085 [candidate division Zixibacteria bacterium HGW-Zixibacteria-1]
MSMALSVSRIRFVVRVAAPNLFGAGLLKHIPKQVWECHPAAHNYAILGAKHFFAGEVMLHFFKNAKTKPISGKRITDIMIQ